MPLTLAKTLCLPIISHDHPVIYMLYFFFCISSDLCQFSPPKDAATKLCGFVWLSYFSFCTNLFFYFYFPLLEKGKIFSLYRLLKLCGPTLRFYYLHQLIIRNERSEKFSYFSWFSDISTSSVSKIIALCQILMCAGLTEHFWFSPVFEGGRELAATVVILLAQVKVQQAFVMPNVWHQDADIQH